jgi:hypothetical protein
MHDVTELHEALARVVVADRELSEVLTEITGIARRAMPDTEAASVTLIRGEKPFTAAYDGQMALDADELQSHTGTDTVWTPAGPAKCSCRGHAGDQRWPEYAQSVATHGVLSSLSVPLPFQGATIGALNTYARRHQASATTMLIWPRRWLPGSRSQSAMRKQQPEPATISLSCALR